MRKFDQYGVSLPTTAAHTRAEPRVLRPVTAGSGRDQDCPLEGDGFLARSDGVPFAALAQREGVSPSYFTRLVRLSYLAPDITQAILDGRQPRELTAAKLLAHSRLPLGWHEQRTVLGFA
ncbi:MAG: hypothetical protein JO095_16895 [Alphaproteobacteria bacterium]|nr:hypothetical protein [Alphaproteobacteria bacterium]